MGISVKGHFLRSLAKIAVVLLFVPGATSATDIGSTLKNARNNDQRIQETLRAASQCIFDTSRLPLRYCTGAIFSENELSQLKEFTFDSCKQAIQKYQFRILTRFDQSLLSKESWDLFEKSSKRAETLHSEKLVLFRDTSTIVDCVHEYLHLRQRRPEASNLLSPETRNALLRKAQADLESLATDIAKHEARGDLSYGKRLEPELAIFLGRLERLSGLQETIDEVEPHGTIEYGCRNGWKCTEDDIEVALAHLIRLREYLPKRDMERVFEEVESRLKAKRARIVTEVVTNWKCPVAKASGSSLDRETEVLASNPWVKSKLDALPAAESKFITGDLSRREFDSIVLTAEILRLMIAIDKCLDRKGRECRFPHEMLLTPSQNLLRETIQKCFEAK